VSPYVVTIDGLKIVPAGLLLNALIKLVSVTRTVLLPSVAEGIDCSYVVEPCVTRSLRNVMGEGKDIFIILLNIKYY
jgi:hypothetical protein